MDRRDFFKMVAGAVASVLMAPAAPAVVKPLPKIIIVDELTAWWSLVIQTEIDREIICDLCRIAGKPMPEKYAKMPPEQILHEAGYRLAERPVYEHKEKFQVQFA